MRVLGALVCGLSMLVCVAGYAQQPPTTGNAIRIVVPYPPGSSGDLIARRIIPRLSQEMGNTIIVENRQGANGNIGMSAVAKAKPDGYTFILGSDIQFAVAPVLFQSLPFDVDKDFEPVGPVAAIDLVVAAYPGLPANNLQEVVALAKKTPGQVSFASTGLVIVRKSLLQAHPWVANNLRVAFEHARKPAVGELLDSAVCKSSLIWESSYAEEERAKFGDAFVYGVDENRVTLDAMCRYGYEQGFTSRLLKPEDIFFSTTLTSSKV